MTASSRSRHRAFSFSPLCSQAPLSVLPLGEGAGRRSRSEGGLPAHPSSLFIHSHKECAKNHNIQHNRTRLKRLISNDSHEKTNMASSSRNGPPRKECAGIIAKPRQMMANRCQNTRSSGKISISGNAASGLCRPQVASRSLITSDRAGQNILRPGDSTRMIDVRQQQTGLRGFDRFRDVCAINPSGFSFRRTGFSCSASGANPSSILENGGKYGG